MADDYTQPGNLVRWMNDSRKKHRFNNLAEAMQGVAKKTGLEVEKYISWSKLSLKELAGKQPNKAAAVTAV